MKELTYPFDSEYILRKKKTLKKELEKQDTSFFLTKKIAVLGGSTTHDILLCLELFLLDQEIRPIFFESEYAKYWETAMFQTEELKAFQPDLIYIHTTNKNLTSFPEVFDSLTVIDEKLETQFSHFYTMWEHLKTHFSCPIIQNNFDLPKVRLLGNQDISNSHGFSNFVERLNGKLYQYTNENPHFYIHDILSLSARLGLDFWFQESDWHLYKYAPALKVIPDLAFQLSQIIKSLFGKNKKVLALDLDQTLWGGIVGDDGVGQLKLGEETAVGEAYTDFQKYLKKQKDLGVILTVVSKNEQENALAGLNHPDTILRPGDFFAIKANWEPKSKNIRDLADELNLLPESFVFVDDNPAERELVRQTFVQLAVPELSQPEEYKKILDRNGYFEVTNFSKEDQNRNQMYRENAKREQYQQNFSDYAEYLHSLKMKAEIAPFDAVYLDRITQLTNKTNQFNLTTKRYTSSEIEEVYRSAGYLHLYGRLIDKFGDNGIVSIVVGSVQEKSLHLELWLMSCRVLKRDMEWAMLDQLVQESKKRNMIEIYGYYYKTGKNAMVKNFYADCGFTKVSETKTGDSVWKLKVCEYQEKNKVIEVKKNE